MDCYNYSCTVRFNQLPTSATRCDCIACPNRFSTDGYVISNRTLSKEELNALEKKKRDDDWNYGVGVWC